MDLQFARLAGLLTLKNNLSPEEYALLAPARRPALHILWKIHIHIAEQLKAVKNCKKIKQCKQNKTLQTSDRY
jgi:hypothetical protein